jgi:hypothetical protein
VVLGVTKQLKAFRFDPDIYEKFKASAKNSNLIVTEALEKFMHVCVELGAVRFPESTASRRDAETEARVLLAWLKKGQYWYYLKNEDNSYSITGRLLQLLPRIGNEPLRSEIERELKKES